MAVDTADLTARLNAVREVLHIEIAAAGELLAARIEGMDAQRGMLLTGLNERTRLLQEEIDRRLRDLTALADERRDNSVLANRLLQEELDRRLTDMDKLNVQRWSDLKELVLEGQAAADKAVQAALVSAEKAVTVAQAASEKRLDGVNEFRRTLADQTATFVPRPENDAQLKSLSDRVAGNADRMGALELRLTSRLDLGQGEDRGQQRQSAERRLDFGLVLQLLAVIISVAAIVVVLALR